MIRDWQSVAEAKRAGASVRYAHEGYGCDSGCCGHRFVVQATNGDVLWTGFEFSHDRALLDQRAGEIAADLTIGRGVDEFYARCGNA